jgi:hypothetical protein
MVGYLLAAFMGLLIGLAWCYINQIKQKTTSTLGGVGSILSGASSLVKNLGITKDDIAGLFGDGTSADAPTERV